MASTLGLSAPSLGMCSMNLEVSGMELACVCSEIMVNTDTCSGYVLLISSLKSSLFWTYVIFC